MAWSAVTWAYKDLVTSAKLAQMQENIRTHDHRADGTQGDPAAIISGPTFGAAAATLTSAVQATVATIVLPATLRKSTLWISTSLITGAGYQRIDVSMTPLDARITIGLFSTAPTTFVTAFTGGSVTNVGEQFLVGIPVAAGAATGTSMLFKLTAVAGNATECRALWWVDS